MSSFTRFSKRQLTRLLPLFGYCALVLLVFWPAIAAPEGQMIFGDDIHRQYYFYRQFFNNWIHAGIFPWWNPYLFGGEPFIANPVTNIWYPPTWLFMLIKLPTAYAIHLMLHIVWACFGMYMVLREKRQTFSLASWVGGVVFGLSGFFMARTFAGHVDVIAAASWMPWVVWRFGILGTREENAMRLRRNTILASIVFALQVFAGYQTMAFFTVILVGMIIVAHSIRQRSFRPMVLAAIAGIGGVLLSAIQIIPEQEFFRQSIRTFSLPYSWISYGSLTWESFIQLVSPFFFGNQYTYAGPPPNFIEHSAYIGIGGLVLALYGFAVPVIHMLRMARVGGKSVTGPTLTHVAACIVVLFGFWISLGPNAPIDLQYILWKIVPMYHYLRIPPRHLIIAIFGLSVLAAYGFRAIGERIRIPYVRWVLALVVTVELVLFGKGFIVTAPIPESRHDQSLVKLLLSDGKPYRLLQNYGVWLTQRDGLDFDGVMSYGISSATGYDPSILRPYYSFIAESTGIKGEDAVLGHDVQIPYLTPREADSIDALSIKYIQVPNTHDPFMGNSRYRLLMENTALHYRIYENTTVHERFYLRDPQCGDVTVTEYSPNTIKLSVLLTCDSHLNTSDVWYPGWAAYVDGKKVEINKLNNVFRTISVFSGNHEVVMVYSPIIFVIGGLLSLLTALVMTVVWCREYFHESLPRS